MTTQQATIQGRFYYGGTIVLSEEEATRHGWREGANQTFTWEVTEGGRVHRYVAVRGRKVPGGVEFELDPQNHMDARGA